MRRSCTANAHHLFKSTSLREARHKCELSLIHSPAFKSTSLREARLDDGRMVPDKSDLNPLASGRLDINHHITDICINLFKSTSLREARPLLFHFVSLIIKIFKSTSLREARRIVWDVKGRNKHI